MKNIQDKIETIHDNQMIEEGEVGEQQAMEEEQGSQQEDDKYFIADLF